MLREAIGLAVKQKQKAKKSKAAAKPISSFFRLFFIFSSPCVLCAHLFLLLLSSFFLLCSSCRLRQSVSLGGLTLAVAAQKETPSKSRQRERE